MRDAICNTRHLTAGIAAAIAGLSCDASAAQSEPEQEEEHFYLSDEFLYDDNLFRVSADATPQTGIDPTLSREDYVNRITAGLEDDMSFGRQVLKLKGRVHDVRFRENDQLDHTAGDALLALDWRLLGSWSGTLSGGYNRVLADFAHLRTTSKDVVETAYYAGSARYRLGPRWAVFAHGQHTQTEHSLDLRTSDDMDADQGRFGIDYTTPSEHAFGLEYRYLHAEFPNRPLDSLDLGGAEYEESAALARLTYTATVRTRLEAVFGYVDRDDPNGTEGEYCGNTWRAEIDWHPREKFSTVLTAWHELKSYVDAESDYFIADGVSLAPEWSPVRSISISVGVSYEEQEYIGSAVPLDETAPRNDDVLAALTTLSYSPRPNLQLKLQYLLSDRDSNREARRYDAEVASATIRWGVM